MELDNKTRKSLNRNQQGELNAVIMYEMLASRMKNPADIAAMKRLAADEQRHADAFYEITGDKVKTSKAQGIVISALYRVTGRKLLFRLMAIGEYAAYKGYASMIQSFPQLEEVRNDEEKHGDALMALSKQ